MNYHARALNSFKPIETFYWAARLGSFTAAAERLHTCQSTVSMRIHELETALGVALFDRSLRTVRLTPNGRDVVQYAERFINLRAELEHQIVSPKSLSGTVRLGVAEVVSLTWLPKFVQTIHRIYPRVSLAVEQDLVEHLIKRLRAGEIDLVFAPGMPAGSDLDAEPLGHVEFRWMASPRLDLPNEPLTPKTLSGYPIISLSTESFHFANISAWFKAGGVVFRPQDTCTSVGVVAALVCAGLGVGFLPLCCHSRDIELGRLQILRVVPEIPPIQFSAIAATGRNDPVSRALVATAIEASSFQVSLNIAQRVPRAKTTAKKGSRSPRGLTLG